MNQTLGQSNLFAIRNLTIKPTPKNLAYLFYLLSY